jgi:hypothetical protein
MINSRYPYIHLAKKGENQRNPRKKSISFFKELGAFSGMLMNSFMQIYAACTAQMTSQILFDNQSMQHQMEK